MLAPTSGGARVENLGSMPPADLDIGDEAVELAQGAAAGTALEAALDDWLTLTASSLLGVGARAIEIGVDYVKEPHAFGVPIGSFQAISCRLADSATAIDRSQMVSRKAAWAREAEADRYAEFAAIAFAFSCVTARDATYRSLHLLGGLRLPDGVRHPAASPARPGLGEHLRRARSRRPTPGTCALRRRRRQVTSPQRTTNGRCPVADAVIVSACRTTVGAAFEGPLIDTSAFDLADVVVSEALRCSGVGPETVDEADVVIAGGARSASTPPVARRRVRGTDYWADPWYGPTHPDRPDAPNMDMSITVRWNAAQEANVTRREMDEWAVRSHARAVAAIDGGRFADEIVPVSVQRRDGTTTSFDTDEHQRRDSTLGTLKPLHPDIEGFSVTGGNSSGINDGAAAIILTSADLAAAKGLTPLAPIRAWSAWCRSGSNESRSHARDPEGPIANRSRRL